MGKRVLLNGNDITRGELEMKKIVLAGLAACLFLFVLADAGSATLIDFEGVAPASSQYPVGNNYMEDGYNFYNPRNFDDAAIIGQPGQNTSGSDYYTWNSPAANNPITLTNILGDYFNLSSLDVGTKYAILGSFDITGFFSNGTNTTYSVIDVSSFQNIGLNWLSLTKVEFSYVSGDFGAIDNLVVDAAPIPEPATMLLFGTGLVGLAGTRIRKKKK